MSGETEIERISASLEVAPDGVITEAVDVEAHTGDTEEELLIIYREILDPVTPSPNALEYVKNGGSLASLIDEITQLRADSGGEDGPAVSEVDKELIDSRQAYIDALTRKLGIRNRDEHREERDETEERYADAVVAKLSQVLETGPQEALQAGQLPKLVKNVSFDGEDADELEELAGNHLHVMIDVLLKEEARRGALVERFSYKGLEKVVDTWQHNRWLRASMAAGIFALSMTPKLNLFSEDRELIVEHVDTGLQVAAGYIFMHDIQESGYINIADFAKRRRARRDREALAGDKLLADLALRTAYNEIHYTSYGTGVRPDRIGTDDPEENARRFDNLDRDFDRFQNEPGGWPYTGQQMLDYASRLYLHRMEQIEAITKADSRKELFLRLTRELLCEDLQVLRNDLTGSRVRRAFIRGVSLGVSAVMGRYTAGMGEAAHLSRESVRTVDSELTHAERKLD
ncbi:MAG TPA: hypothetical protein VFW77_01330 [Candidatus Saccharimonadales bacterium]|nr:hypothetical protein [Candidatus Saccharimonadales bacterium]